MATVHSLVPKSNDYYALLQACNTYAEAIRHKRLKAVIFLQKVVRGYLIRKWVAWLSYNATIIQSVYRGYWVRMRYLNVIRTAVRLKYGLYYFRRAQMLQALWRGYSSRRNTFCYRTYRLWLQTVTERGERLLAETVEFGMRSRVEYLQDLEEEARKWVAFVVFKLHHLLRTYANAGIYSDLASAQLTEFEKLLKAIHYTDYMKRLHRKYAEFVKKNKPLFSNKRYFPIIGEGQDYWYLSLPEMYEMTKPLQNAPLVPNRHLGSHHGPIHKRPFIWRNPKHDIKYNKAFIDAVPPLKKELKSRPQPTSVNSGGDATLPKDPRFHLYVQHYKPTPDVLQYVNFHINVLLRRQEEFTINGDANIKPRTAGKQCMGNVVAGK